MTKPTHQELRRLGGASALGLALCATFTGGTAQAAVVLNDIPDVTLGNFDLVIEGTPVFSFFRDAEGAEEFVSFLNGIDTGENAVVGYLSSETFFGETKRFAEALEADYLISGDPSVNYISSAEDDPVVLSEGVTKFGAPFDEIGEFFDNGTAFIGLRFELPNTTGFHFGCVEATGSGNQVTINSYAYESTPGAGILAGACATVTQVEEPSPLALLIAGAAGVLILRRRQNAR